MTANSNIWPPEKESEFSNRAEVSPIKVGIGGGGEVVSCSEQLAELLDCQVSDLIGHSIESVASFRCRNTGRLLRSFCSALMATADWANVPEANICLPTGDRYPVSAFRIRSDSEPKGKIELQFAPAVSGMVQVSQDLILLHATARMAKVGGWDLDPATGKVRWTDQTFRIHDLEPGDPPRLADALSFYVAADRQILESALQDALLNGIAFDLELRLVTAKGRTCQTRAICHPVISGGKTIRLIGTIQDITEQSQTETALIESESRYRDLFENNNAIKLLIDPNTLQIIEVNSAAVKFYGYSVEEFRNLKISDLNVSDEQDVRKAITAVAEHKVSELEFQHRLASGETKEVKVHTGTITLNEKTLVHSIIFDITERKRAQEAVIRMQQMQSLGTLAGGIAHDFNNVLTAIFGNLSLASHSLDADHPAMEFLMNAENSIERATGLSRQLLTFAKGGAPVPQNVDLSELISDVIHFDLTGSNVRPVFALDPDLWNVRVDPAQLQQVFSNLTLNADYSMPDGGCLEVFATNVTLRSQQITGVEAGEYVKVMFKDNGQGIGETALPRIFEPYFSTKPSGNGLGLATSYSIIQKHNGHIEVSSQPELGTTFTIFLPAISNEKSESRRNGLPSVPQQQWISRVLVLDDEVMILEVLTQMLSTIGATSEAHRTTNRVVEAYRREFEAGTPFDVVILDLTIPGGPGGRDAARRILEIDPDATVICTTGYTDDPIMVDHQKYGFRGVIPKPYQLEELRAVIASLQPRRTT